MRNNFVKNKIQLWTKKGLTVIAALVLLAMMAACNGEAIFSDASATPNVSQEAGNPGNASVAPEKDNTPTVTSTSTPTPTFTPTPTNTPTPTEVPQMTICMVGDILLHDTLEDDCRQADGSYDYHSLFENTKDIISSYDLALVNQELIIGGAGLGVSGYPSFNTDFTLADALEDTGFDVVLHATNHALDKGKKGLLNCIHNWKQNHSDMGVIGIYESEGESRDIYVTEINGIRVAILNFTYGTNGISAPEDMPWCVNMLTEENVISALDEAEKLADFTIMCPHWGTEYSLDLSTQQKNYMMLFKEHGADLVIGTHPHVIQSITVVNEEGETECLEEGYELSPNDMLVYYSLGNFVSWTGEQGKGIANRMLGGIADITVKKNDEGKAYIADFGIIPVVSHVEKGQNVCSVYPFYEYTGDMAEKSAIIPQDSTYSLQYLYDLCCRIWGNLWKEHGTPDLNTAEAFERDIKLSLSNDGSAKKLQDESYKTAVAFSSADTLSVSSDGSMFGLYIKWDKNPGEWTLEYDGKTLECGKNGFLHEYVVIPEGTEKCIMHFSADEAICEVYAYSAGKLPKDVQVWEPAFEKADILVFSTHADDEILFLGGVLAQYGGILGKKVQLVYMSEYFSSEKIREHEKLDGVWTTGVKNYPACGNFPDKYSETLEEAKRIYKYDDVLAFIAENIRRFKPQVVVTQDINGEYGHGGHLLLVDAVINTVDRTSDPEFCPDSAALYGTWNTPKTYLHLYKEGKLKLDLRQPAEVFDGKTAFDVLTEAYSKHVSQQWCWFYVSDGVDKPNYKYSCADFGLYRTTVGPDTGNDMLENVTTYGD